MEFKRRPEHEGEMITGSRRPRGDSRPFLLFGRPDVLIGHLPASGRLSPFGDSKELTTASTKCHLFWHIVHEVPVLLA